LEVILAKSAGFCFGVNNVLKTIFQLIEKKEKPVYTFGPVIHNEQMVNYLEEQGVVTLNDIDEIEKIKDNNVNLIIRAHGIPPYDYNKLKTYGNLSVIDRTCPYVQKIHKLVRKKYEDGYKIIITGDAKHPEVIGINGECEDNAIIIDKPEDIDNIGELSGKICVVSQTTFNQNKWEKLISMLKEKCKDAEFYNTICNSTIVRQKEAEEIAKKVDMMIVIGGKNSSNTSKLYEICKMYCNETYKIETVGELPPININKIKKIGITAGASTPDWIIKEVLQKMEELNRQSQTQNQMQANIESQEPEQEINFAEALESSFMKINSGEIVKGTVFKISNEGVIVDLGGKYEGTIPPDELSDDPYYNPKENLKVGQEIEVLVLRVNDSEADVILSKKRADVIRGWDILEKAFEDKTPVRARVMEIVNGGVMAIAYGIKIFIPASQLSDRYVKNLNEYLKQIVTIRILDFDRRKKKIVGSQRVILEEQKELLAKELWSSIEVGKVYKGKVKSFTNYGAFVDIGGVEGLLHISEISWKKIKHPSEVLRIGEEIEVKVLDFDKEKKKISLGYKKPADDPWKTVAQKYYIGDVVKGKVVRIVPFGCFVQFDEALDGLVHISQISNKRIAKPEEVLMVGQEVAAKIIEMDIENKRIGLSIKEVNPIDPGTNTDEADNSQHASGEEEIPTEHKEELSGTIGEALKGKIDLKNIEE